MNQQQEVLIRKCGEITEVWPGEKGDQQHPGSIISGRLGFSILLFELYKMTGGNNTYRRLLSEIDWLEEYYRSRMTDNYSLLRGKGGLALLYLQLFEHTADPVWLDKAMAVVRAYYVSDFFRYGIVSNYSLGSGLAGILLLSAHLYLHTRESWLLDLTERALIKLLSASHAKSNGVFWGGITDADNTSIGLVRGAAGISFVLSELGYCFGNPLLSQTAGRAMQYEEGHLRKDARQDKRDSAISILKLYQAERSGPISVTDVDALTYYIDLPAMTEKAGSDAGILSGVCGAALMLTEACRLTGDDRCNSIITGVSGQLLSHSEDPRLFLPASMKGWWGLGYCLLRLASTGGEAGLFLLPRLKRKAEPDDLPSSSVFAPASRKILETLVRRDFKDTMSLLAERHPKCYDLFFDGRRPNRPDDFAPYVQRLLSGGQNFPGRPLLQFQFDREQFGMSLKNEVKEAIAGDDNTILHTHDLLALPDRQFQQLKLAHSDKTWVFTMERPLTQDMRFTPETFAEFLRDYGSGSVQYWVTDQDRLATGQMGISRLVFDRFAVATSVQDAFDWVSVFLLKQDGGTLKVLEKKYDVTGQQKMMEAFRLQFMDGVRYYLAEGILEQVPSN
jgi:hypothetical protein